MKHKLTYPHFLCIGVQKSGTTWLYENLRTHPEICLKHIKEVHYFDTRGLSLLQLCRKYTWRQHLKHNFILGIFKQSLAETGWYFRYLFLRRNDSWFASLFRSCGGKLIGDITPGYSILSPKEIEHVASIMPAAKIILLLRSPIERAWSHARMSLSLGTGGMSKVQCTSIDNVAFHEWRRHFDTAFSTHSGDYVSIQRNWGYYFPASQIFVGYIEEIEDSPVQFLNRVSTFLGIEPDPAQGWPHAEQSFNAQPVSEMPPKVAHYLSLKYIGGLKELENCHLLDNVEFVKKWREDAEHYLEQYCRN